MGKQVIEPGTASARKLPADTLARVAMILEPKTAG